MYKVDAHGEIVATYQTGDGARQLSFAEGRLWVANQDAGTVTGIDAATGEQRTYGFGHRCRRSPHRDPRSPSSSTPA